MGALQLVFLVVLVVAVVGIVRARRRSQASTEEFDEPLIPPSQPNEPPMAGPVSTAIEVVTEADRGGVMPTPARRLESPVQEFWEAALEGYYETFQERGLTDEELRNCNLAMVIATLVLPPWRLGAVPDRAPPADSIRSHYGHTVTEFLKLMTPEAVCSFEALPLFYLIVANGGDALEVQHAAVMIWSILSDKLNATREGPDRVQLVRHLEIAGCHAWNVSTRGGDLRRLPPKLGVWLEDKITDGEPGLPARTRDGHQFVSLATFLEAWTPERLLACADRVLESPRNEAGAATGTLKLLQLSLRQRAFERCHSDAERLRCLVNVATNLIAQYVWAPTPEARKIYGGVRDSCVREVQAIRAASPQLFETLDDHDKTVLTTLEGL